MPRSERAAPWRMGAVARGFVISPPLQFATKLKKARGVCRGRATFRRLTFSAIALASLDDSYWVLLGLGHGGGARVDEDQA